MARPRHYDDPASTRVTIRLTADQRQDLEQVAREHHQPLSGVIRDSINTYVNDYREQAVFRTQRPRR